MEILFNNEAAYQAGSFFSIRQELNKDKVTTYIKVGRLKEPDNIQVYQINESEFKALINLFQCFLKNPEYLLTFESIHQPYQEAVIIE